MSKKRDINQLNEVEKQNNSLILPEKVIKKKKTKNKKS